MQKNYNHKTEDDLYAEWKKSKKMRADNQSKKKAFTIPLPPPNVTGQLHLGHAAMLAIEDIMIRFKKMTDHEVLWIPGTDHAAIATENVVLKHLKAKSREEYSRKEFLEHCKKFASEKHDTICNQMEKMGAWLDWSREAYTFDSERNFAVNRMFKMLYDDGLIVRGHRMINWSVGAQSVISDDELEYEDIKEPFYYIKCGEFIVGTVRPETKCANSPVVVHPDSEYVKIEIKGDLGDSNTFIISKYLLEDKDQFQKVFNLLGEDLEFKVLETFLGKDLEGIEFEYETYAGKRKFHVLSDSVIDPHKGSGAMTISCNHSADDYDLGKRLNLEEFFFDKIDMEGRMTDIAGPCMGQTVIEARKNSGKLMEEMGLLVGKDKTYEHRVPLCYRSGCVIEPMISPQWFISVEKEFEDKFSGKKTTLKKQMQEAVRDGHIKIIPQKFEKEYFRWIDNLRDWCISRQIWWGHQIPVWYDENKNIHLPSEKKIVFARHGQSEANANNIFQGSGVDTPLTKKGRTQAKTLAKNLIKSGQKFDMIICSDLLRASETAQIIADELGIKSIKKWQDLREISFGNLEGKTKKEVFGTNSTVFADEIPFIFDDNLGDKFEDTINRRQKLIEKLKQENKNILVVSHETTIATIFATHKFSERLNRELFKLFAENFHLENAGTKDIPFFTPPKEEKKQKIICVRHGESKGNTKKLAGENPKLTEKGKKQAKITAQNLKEFKITKIITSNLIRAQETAQIIQDKLGLNLEIEIWKDLREVNYGEFEGATFDKGIDSLTHFIHTNKKGENEQDLMNRTKKVHKKLEKIKTEGAVLLVAHNTFLSSLFATKEKIFSKDFLNYRRNWHMNNAEYKDFEVTKSSNSKNLTQDQDTLDTWFSSALWPFSTVGWNGDESHADFQKFYPNSVLETGWDILFFWVARMIMFGKYATGDYPFQTVYLHGMVTDEHGKKMSKSKGNGIDPLDMIKDFGADPIRLALVIGSTPGQKIPIGENKIKGYRNFVNKLWNAGRFVEMQKNNEQKKRDSKFCSKGKYFKSTPFDFILSHNILNVKKKRSKTKLNKFYTTINNANKTIVFDGKTLEKHFENKSPTERFFRRIWFFTVVKALSDIKFNQDGIGYFLVNNNVFTVVLSKSKNKYKVKTFYRSKKLSNKYINYPKSLAEKWILSRFSEISKSVKDDLENYQISNAGDKIYHFVWGEFCDWFIEASKINQNPKFLSSLYTEILKLVHPLCPFVTEQIWKELFDQNNDFLIEQSFPEIDFYDEKSVKEFQRIQKITNKIRSLRSENKLNPKEKLKVSGKIPDTQSKKLIENLAGVIFSNFEDNNTQKIIVDGVEIIVEIPIDEARLTKEIDNLKKEISALEGRLANKKYVKNAPEKLVTDTKNSLKKAKEKLKKLE